MAVCSKTGGHLNIHYRRYHGCKAIFEDTVSLSRSKDKLGREVIEAYFIAKNTDKCMSMPSANLLAKELQFLDGLV